MYTSSGVEGKNSNNENTEIVTYCVDPKATIHTPSLLPSGHNLGYELLNNENSTLQSVMMYSATLTGSFIPNSTYNSRRNYWKDNIVDNVDALKKIVALGYPNDLSGFKAKYDLDDDTYYNITKAALLYYVLDTTEYQGQADCHIHTLET